MRGHEGEIRAAALSPHGRHMASAGFDGTVRVWDTTTGQEVHVVRVG